MKHYQESEIEFRRGVIDEGNSYPTIRGIIVHQYGGTLEECIKQAREELGLGDEWRVITAKGKE